MSSSDSQDISASDAYASEETLSSSSTESSSPEPDTRSARKPNIPEPQPVNQMPGQVFAEREDPVSDEPAPYDPDKETLDQWVERLEVAGYSPLPTSFVTDIYPHVSKIALNKARRNLPAGYILEYDENWSNIIEPHRDDRIGFHIASLESGTVFPLRPLLVELCHCFRILPGQITPNAHRLLNSFANICTHLRIDPSLRLFLYMFEVCPGKPGCEGFVYFKGRNNRKFISDLPQSNRLWKERFVFIKFPPSANPLAGLKWSDNLLKHQFTEPHTTPDLEESLEKLLRGDPYTGQMYHYGGWVWRTQPGGEGTSQAHEAAGHGVPSPGDTAEAGGPSHPDMNFRSFGIPKTAGASSSAGLHTSAAKTVPVQKETIEVHSEEDTPLTGGASPAGRGPENPTLHKGKGKMRMKKVATTHPAAKRRRGETSPAGESMEELWVKMTLKLKEMGEVGPETFEKLAGDSPSRSFQLEEKLKGVEAHNQELQDLIARQLDELSHLSAIAGEAKAETLQLKEENLKLLEDLELKEREFPGRAKQWVGENLEETARVITSTPEVTMEAFKFIYGEEQGKEMITQIGSYGFMSGQKRDREATHAILAERLRDFNAESYGLAPIPDEEPAPPFPLE
ncbi:unnamed protein product [Cuscuta campestris]|uniref:Transposase (putative) gypsy type domain-containing protein n=1 Tax=Cuscuta campestris TaxID=132261 RepID=A0A484KEL9_9ASTE|nr:unnamed protein product [Cuscuta campestris]